MDEQIHYKTNYLTEVIARVDFAGPILELEKRLDRQVRDVLLKSFPIPEPKEVLAQHVEASKQSLKASHSTFTEWNFHGRDRDKTLTITPNSISVVYKAYDSFEILQSEFLQVTDKFFGIYADAQGKRLGLRYLNNIRVDESNLLDWEPYINAKMLGFLEFYPNATTTRAIGLLEFSYDGFNVRVQFGMHNPDYPAPMRKKIFVLDLDAYHAGPLEGNEIASNLQQFHLRIQELFELSITDKLREKMNA